MRTIRWRNGQCPGRNGQWAERIAHAGSEAVRLVPFSSLPALFRLQAEGWERIGAGGKQHGDNGAVLASAWGMGRGQHLPAPSPALPTNYTNPAATARHTISGG